MKVFVFLALFVALGAAKEIGVRSYDGYKVVSVVAQTPEQMKLLKELEHNIELDFWTNPKFKGLTDIMASPSQIELITKLFDTQGMTWTYKIQDVGEIIQKEHFENEKMRTKGRMSWTAYQTYAEIERWLLNDLQSNSFATIDVSRIGSSSQNRGLYMVKISSGGSGKPAIFIDGNIHAREWIAGAVATYIVNELATNTQAYTEILSKFDFYIVPMVNPDGYEYSRTTDRMWRKTRSSNAGSICLGCDPNRNFAFQFGGESTSSNPCSDIFKGPNAFSEPETQAIRDAIKDIQAQTTLHAYFTIHSYGQYWLLAWGYTQGVYPPDYPELLSWGQASVAAIKATSGLTYTTGQGADQLYGVGGASDDWSKSEGVKYTVTIETRDLGSNGFVLPPSQIIPAAQEVWNAVQVIQTTV